MSIDPGERRRGRLLVGVVFAIVWGLITHGTFAGSGDEPHYMMIAHSLAFDADLDLANNYREATLIGAGTLVPEAHALEREGRLRPVHDIGMPLALAPAVRLAYSTAERLGNVLPMAGVDPKRLNPSLLLRHQISLVMALLTGLLARELWLAMRDIGGTGWRAFRWALLFAVTPPILSHSFLFFTEIPAALVVLFVFRRLTLQPVRTAGMAAWLGALTGFLWLVHARNVGIVAGLTLVAVGMTRRRVLPTKLLTMFLVAVGVGAFVRTMVTFVLWGDLLTTPHVAFGMPGAGGAVRDVFTRGTGLLFDREYGLFAYGPLYLLALPGLWLLASVPAATVTRSVGRPGLLPDSRVAADDERPRLDRRLVARGAISRSRIIPSLDGCVPLRGPGGLKRTACGGRPRAPADGDQRVRVAVSEDALERRRRCQRAAMDSVVADRD